MEPSDGPAVSFALVDRRYLYPQGVLDAVFNYYMSSYVGHYVVLLSYDEALDAFCMLDPAHPSAEPHVVHASDVHRARVCHGTDEDLLIVPWSQSLVGKRTGAGPGAVAAADASAAA